MTEMERLRARLIEEGVTGFHVTWGPEAHLLTPEQRAAEINKALDAVEAGDYEEILNEPPSWFREKHLPTSLDSSQ